VSSDEEIVGVIVNGVPGTGMPPNALSSSRAYAVVAFLRSMTGATGRKSIAAAMGNAPRGKLLFESKAGCNGCHLVRGVGGRSGPDLSEAGLTLRAIEIEASLLDPDEAYSISTRPFRVVKKDGATVIGMLVNQNTFSVQLSDSKGSLISLPRSEIRESGFLPKSPMPSYRGKLDAQELADIIAYVSSQKGVQ
jgi:putative heme-binding domain-containing protein